MKGESHLLVCNTEHLSSAFRGHLPPSNLYAARFQCSAACMAACMGSPITFKHGPVHISYSGELRQQVEDPCMAWRSAHRCVTEARPRAAADAQGSWSAAEGVELVCILHTFLEVTSLELAYFELHFRDCVTRPWLAIYRAFKGV